jgi:hypothetical protein
VTCDTEYQHCRPEDGDLKVKTSHLTAWNGIIKQAPEPEWAKSKGVVTLNHKSRFDPIYPRFCTLAGMLFLHR